MSSIKSIAIRKKGKTVGNAGDTVGIEKIDQTNQEIFRKIELRQYPFGGDWLDWKAKPGLHFTKLPKNWDKI